MNAMTEIPPKAALSALNLPTYSAEDLTKGGIQACITLDDKIYMLRITKAGKLILTK